ncbi:3-deoxy-manno-octulosonate cytidylyltransferase [Flavobacteriaceae bacterium]|nr:3-deoxy-manno-octulosonate cytidylyltransferase [Flavobacteriaceae bacterium]
MKTIAIIPARMAATRFPGKPMEEILGMPMIGHCYYRTKLSKLVDEVYVATCDKIIFNYIESIGGKAIITSNKHERATERTAEALLNIEKMTSNYYDIVVMVQGDEPLVDPSMIDDSIRPLINGNINVSNLMVRLKNLEEIENPNNVKVAINERFEAIYMSREPIPSSKKYIERIDYFRQLGLISFRKESLIKFIELKMSRLEIIESVDMNRFLENDIKIKMVETKLDVDAVDVPSDLERVKKKMEKDILFKLYKNEN